MVEVYQDPEGGWRFRVKGANGEIVASGEAYSSESNAKRGVQTLRNIMEAGPPIRTV